MSSVTLEADEIGRAMTLLGGKRAFGTYPGNALALHGVIQTGFPGTVLTYLVANVPVVADPELLAKAVGVSHRTLQRRKRAVQSGTKPAHIEKLSTQQSARAWKFAEIVAQATGVLGSQEDAERWLQTPAIGLDQQRPIDLLTTPIGTDLVEQYLERLEYGVYA